jgi:hypothetical protein
VHALLLLRQENKKIGFDWLCFFVPHKASFCLKLLSNKTLRQFAHFEIGFVFSTSLTADERRLTQINDDICCLSFRT